MLYRLRVPPSVASKKKSNMVHVGYHCKQLPYLPSLAWSHDDTLFISVFVQSQLDKLNEIVWPAIAELALKEIEAYTKEGRAQRHVLDV